MIRSIREAAQTAIFLAFYFAALISAVVWLAGQR